MYPEGPFVCKRERPFPLFVGPIVAVHTIRPARIAKALACTDLAEALRWPSDDLYPDAERIVLVWGNLSTRTMGSPYEAFPPTEAARLASRFEVHHTPRHGSWLDMAEIEIGCLMRHRLPARVSDLGEMERLTRAWEDERNARAALSHSDVRDRARRLLARNGALAPSSRRMVRPRGHHRMM